MGVQTISIMVGYLMMKCLLYCNSLHPPTRYPPHCVSPLCAEDGVLRRSCPRGGGGGGVGGLQDRQSSSLWSAHTPPVITTALQILHICPASHWLTLLLPSPHHLRLPSHASSPPSRSSKYFPSLLFEASMGHGTSCTNHAGLPWGGPVREDGSESDA